MQTFLSAGSFTEIEITDGETFGKFCTIPDELYKRYKAVHAEWTEVQKELTKIYSGDNN